MAHIEQDSELFTNIVSAAAIPAGNRFVAFKDVNSAPAVFSLSEKGTFNLFLQTSGRLVNFDFAKICGISNRVTAFDARQSSNNSLFVAFAVEQGAGHEVIVLPNLSVQAIANPPPSAIIKSDLTLPRVDEIFISDYKNDHFVGSDYPDVILAFKPLKSVTKAEDCGLLAFSKSGGGPISVSLSRRWSLPLNASEVLDLAFGFSQVGKGAFVLYRVQGMVKLLYSTYDGSDFDTSIDCPPNASCLAAFVNGRSNGSLSGLSTLLVGSDRITHYTAYQYTRKDRPGTPINGPLMDPGLKDLHVAQNGDSVTMWFTNAQDAGGYYSVSSDHDLSDGQVVPLFPERRGGRLSGMLTTTSAVDGLHLVNTIISADDHSNLTSLQQSESRGAWDAYPIMMSTRTENFDVPSYTSRLRVMADVNTPATNSRFLMTSTGRVSAIINGVSSAIEAGGTMVETDASGEATFIVATDDVSSHEFYISSVTDSSGNRIEIPQVTVTPSAKGQAKLDKIRNGEDLKAQKLPDGRPLVDVKKVSEDDISNAGTVLGQIADEAKALALLTPSEKARRKEKLQADPSLSLTPGEFWGWATDQWHKVKEWYIEVRDSVAHFIIALGEDIYTFVLDSVHTIGKAITFVFKKLQVLLDELIQFLGFLFDWGDIVDAKNSFSAFLTAGLDWTAGKVDSAIPLVEQYFDKMKTQIEGTSTKQDDRPVDQGPPSFQDTNKSMSFNWSKYQLIHGGGAEEYQNEEQPSNPDPFRGVWSDLIYPTVNDLVTDIEKTCRDAASLFQGSQSSISVQQAIETLAKDTAITLIDVIKNITKGVMELVRDMIKWIKDVGNTVINIPVFSALYRMVSGGHELTMFDVLCLVLAIPATIMAKLITESPLPKIDSIMISNGPATIQGYVDGTLEPNLYQKINTVAAYGAISGTFVGVALSVIGIGFDWAGTAETHALSRPRRFDAVIGNPIIRSKAVPAADIPTIVRAYDLLNLITGLTNTFFALPIYNAKVSEWERWTMWGMMAGRTSISGIAYLCKIKNDTAKKIIATFQAISNFPQLYFQIDVAIKSGGGAEPEARKIAIAACYCISALSKWGAVMFQKKDPEEWSICEILYVYLGLASAGLQLWNISEQTQFPWEPVPTFV